MTMLDHVYVAVGPRHRIKAPKKMAQGLTEVIHFDAFPGRSPPFNSYGKCPASHDYPIVSW